MTKLSSVLTHRLRDLLASGNGALGEDEVRTLVEETGASGADLRKALDELNSGFGGGDVAQQQAWRRVISDYASSLSNPAGVRGKRPHEVMGTNVAKEGGAKKPWYAGVKAPDVGPLVSTGAPKDVTVAGERISVAELQTILKSIGAR